jgi:hypothetical protein
MSTQFRTPTTTEAGVVAVNGYTWGALGAIPVRLDGLLTAGAVERALMNAPGVLGQLIAPYITVGPRTIVCAVVLVVDTASAQLDALERLRRACAGVVHLTLDASAHTTVRALCTGFEAEPALGTPGMDDSLLVTLTFTAYDTARYRNDVTPYALVAGQSTPLLHGDALSVARYVHVGASSGPVTLSLLSPARRVVSTLTFAVTLSSAQRLVFDWGTGTINREPGGGEPPDLVLSGGPWLRWAPDGGLDARTNPDSAMHVHLSAGAGMLYLRDAWSF